MGKNEISGLVFEACKNTKSWNVASNGLRETTFEMGKIIGTKRDCGSLTLTIRVLLKGNSLHTAYPL